VALTACCGIFRDAGSFSVFIDIVSLVMGRAFKSFCSTNVRTFFVTGIEFSVFGPITCFLLIFFSLHKSYFSFLHRYTFCAMAWDFFTVVFLLFTSVCAITIDLQLKL